MLTDTRLRDLKPQARAFQVADGRGLFIEVLPGGKRVWRLRYRFAGKQEKVTLGEYPAYSLAVARKWREECRAMVAQDGKSPMRAKQKAKAVSKDQVIVEAFAGHWLAEVVEKTNKAPKNVRRVVEKDIIPAIGKKRLSEVTVSDVLVITDRIKARGADQSALLARNVLKRLFAYAIAREKATFNPAVAVEARYIAQAKSRDVALSPVEIGKLTQNRHELVANIRKDPRT